MLFVEGIARGRRMVVADLTFFYLNMKNVEITKALK